METTPKYQTRNKVSVLIIVYNTPAATLTESVISLLNQSRQPDEIVIVNNGSTNKETNFYLELINRYRDNIKVINLNYYGTKAVKIGLEHCTHEIVLHWKPEDKAEYDTVKELLLAFKRNI